MNQQTPSEILKAAREAKGWTQDAMAKKLDISQRQYQRYEEGYFPKEKRGPVMILDKLLGTSLYGIIYDKKVPHGTLKQESANQVLGNASIDNNNAADKANTDHIESPDLHTLIKTMEDFARANVIREEKEKILGEAHLRQTKMLEAQMNLNLNSSSETLEDNQKKMRKQLTDLMQYQRMWVGYFAEQASGGDKNLYAKELARLGKLLADQRPLDEKMDTQMQDNLNKK